MLAGGLVVGCFLRHLGVSLKHPGIAIGLATELRDHYNTKLREFINNDS